MKVPSPHKKAGSKLPLTWTEKESQDFEALKNGLGKYLSLYQVVPDQLYQMHTDDTYWWCPGTTQR